MEQFNVETPSTPMAPFSNYYLPTQSATGIPTNSFGSYNMPPSMPLMPPTGSTRNFRRDRIIFTSKHLEAMEALFSHSPFPDCESRRRLAMQIEVDEHRVHTWFKNRRAKMRRQVKHDKEMTEWKRQVLAGQHKDSSPSSSANLVTVIPSGKVKANSAAPVETTVYSSCFSVEQVKSQYEYTAHSIPTFDSYCPVKTYYKTNRRAEEDSSFDRLFPSG